MIAQEGSAESSSTTKRLIFVHIPKTGGTTLRMLLATQFDEGDVVRTRRTEWINGELTQLMPESCQFLSGHIPFGVHEGVAGNVQYVTMFREPLARSISEYHARIRREGETESLGSLESYLRSEQFVSNRQTRLILGETDRASGISRAGLDRARKNLEEHFLLAGITERFDECVVLLARKLGWGQIPAYIRRNITARRLKVSNLSAKELRLIRESSELDSGLYEYANQLLDAEIHSVGRRKFLSDLRAYRQRNRFHQLRCQSLSLAKGLLPSSLKRKLTEAAFRSDRVVK